ncbi:hypothetical protein Q0590_09735 [Rhodocytophaga aerolata]|uniref:Uncharacterized protein n=1 Tax=Rhodocytophaga aerolata TaxID=455078 RepID=A0ABT8R769_9BACT|nr:hypothetical protein [Rhodocytophaga aerolata]MDO1446530.1 hypothetical protein [Rhodocytophaga aerolata]
MCAVQNRKKEINKKPGGISFRVTEEYKKEWVSVKEFFYTCLHPEASSPTFRLWNPEGKLA